VSTLPQPQLPAPCPRKPILDIEASFFINPGLGSFMQVQVGCFRLTQAMSLNILVASSDSCMAEFVKELHFEPRAVLEGDSAIVNASRNAWKRPFNFLVHSVKAQRTHKSVVEAIRRLKSVSSVRICFTSMGDPTRAILRKTLPLIHSTLQCYAENLTLLAITVPLVEVPNLLPPFLIFPRLRTLSLFLYRRLKAPHDQSATFWQRPYYPSSAATRRRWKHSGLWNILDSTSRLSSKG